MSIFYVCLGSLLFILITFDIIKTAFSSNGGGQITKLVMKGVWHSFLTASGRNGKAPLLEYAGLAVLVSNLAVWVLGLWASLFLLLLSDEGSVVNSTTFAQASALEKLYYAAFTLSTLGVGDYNATSDLWRMVTSVAAYCGLILITTSITYFVPVLSAVGLQSKLSLYINGLGSTPQQILTNGWNGKDFSVLFEYTTDLSQMVMQHTMNHQAYPVIHYFHRSNLKQAIVPAIVMLEEVYLLLAHAVPEVEAKNKIKMAVLQTSIQAYLDLVQQNFLKKPSPREPAPFPGLLPLHQAGIPLQQQEQIYLTYNQKLKDRRELLTVLLQEDGWTWKDVYADRS